MTDHSHDMETKFFKNDSDNGLHHLDSRSNSDSLDEGRSPSQDLPDDFRSCNEILSPRQSEDGDIIHQQDTTSTYNRGETDIGHAARSSRSSTSSQDASSSATLHPTRTVSREAKKEANGDEQSKLKPSTANGSPVRPEPSIEVSTPSESPSPDAASQKSAKVLDPIFIGGLKAIREMDNESAKSPTIASPTISNAATLPRQIQTQSRGSITLLDRFGRGVWVHHNAERDMDEVHVDEDGNYYVFGQGGFRVRLREGQIQADNTSQPFCISNGKKVNLLIVPDALRMSALQDPKPSTSAPISPRTEPIINNNNNNNNNNNKSDPFSSPSPNATAPELEKPKRPAQKTRIQHSRTPWTDLFSGVAKKSKTATTCLTKGVRGKKKTKKRSSSLTAGPVEPLRTIQQQSSLRTASRTSSADKSGSVETGNGEGRKGKGKSERRRLAFLGQGGPKRVPRVVDIRKKMMLRRG